jgi:hypothetical protein
MKIKAKWQVEKPSVPEIKPAQNIELGGLYEIWIDDDPESVVVVGPAPYGCYNIIVGRRHETIAAERIFELGTAPRPDSLTSMSKMFADQIRAEEDQKILKFLSEMQLNR